MTLAKFANAIKRVLGGLMIAVLFAGAAAAQEAYRLGEGDVVRMSVYQRPDLSVEARLGQGGEMYIPGGGNLQLGGQTLRQARSRVASMIAQSGAASDPQVDIQVSEFGSQKVSVFGFVGQPGSYILDRPTVLSELLAQAGGIVPEGSEEVILLRRSGKESVRSVINVRNIIEAGNVGADTTVKDGDIVTVPRAPRVYVYGAVNRPGAYKLESGMTPLEMISLAGGLSPTGSDNRLEVVRKSDGAGAKRSIKFGLQDQLAAEDVLIVRESIF